MSKFFNFIGAFIFNKLKEYTLKYVRIGFVVTINALILSIHIAVIILLLRYILKIYSFYNYLIDYINSLDFIFIKMLHSIGFFKAFNDVFSLFAPYLITIIFIISSGFVVNTFKSIRSAFDSVNLARID